MAGRLSAQRGFSGGSNLALSLGLALALATAGVLGSRSALAQGRGSASEGQAGPRSDQGSLHYTNKKSFRIPFDIEKAGRSKIKWLQLWASKDLGEHWEAASRVEPDRPFFTYRAARDGEYWFAVRIHGTDGQLYPSANEDVAPGMKVMVDTKAPSLTLEPEGRRGTEVAVRWEVRDENLDLKSFVLEYKPAGVREWRKVPVRKAALIGSQRWDVDTADSVEVRAVVGDKAGNEAVENLVISDGTASLPPSSSAENRQDEPPPPSISQVSDSAGIMAGPGFAPVDEGGEDRRPRGSGTSRVKGAASLSRPVARPGQSASNAGDSAFDRAPGAGNAGREMHPGSRPGGSIFDSMPASPGVGGGSVGMGNPGQGNLFGSPNGSGAVQPSGPAAGNTSEPLPPVGNPKFALQYEIIDAGPNGPATVELWVTRDRGRTWVFQCADLDKVSPIDVDLGSDGTYGIRLVSRSAFGRGDQPPVPGDQPDRWIVVDSTPPVVQIDQVQVGTGDHAGKVAIAWRSSDPHPSSDATRLLWRRDQPGSSWETIVEGQPNSGQFIWAVPPGTPGKFHLRVETSDSLGHIGGAETNNSKPIIVDLSQPRSRIMGLVPNARNGAGFPPTQTR